MQIARNRRTVRSKAPLWAGGMLSLVSCVSALGAETGKPLEPRKPDDFTSLSLEELGSIQVTSVSKKSEALNQVPAAVTVITGDDIRRSGSLTLPEALRLAPGVQVGRVDAAQSAVSVRGFNDTFSQKLLVLMDGRSVYSPLFSGVFWQAQDTMLEDVDRIEVIRGPGGSIWGANAVNGVINIVSKSASETQGVLVTGAGGVEHLAATGVRYGTKLGEHTYFRIYGKYDDWDNSRLTSGGSAGDSWWKGQTGMRLDWEPSTSDRFTVQGDFSGLRANQVSPQSILPNAFLPVPSTGYNFTRATHWDQSAGNVLGRWTHQFSEESDFSIQSYVDRSRLDMALLNQTRTTFDLDARQRFQLGGRNEVVWGGGYRLTSASMTDSPWVTMSRNSRADQIVNMFAQDEIKLIPDRLRLTLGTKIEHNDYTGFEVQPSGRLSWTPTTKQTVWASIARAVRTPSQFERDATVRLAVLPANPPTSPLPSVLTVVGNSGFKSETLVAYEMGYRVQVHRQLTFDTAVFLNDYDNLRSTDGSLDLSQVPNYTLVRSLFNNTAGGHTYGGELSTHFQATDWWRLHGQFSLIRAELHQPPDSLAGPRTDPSISSPTYQASLRSSMELGEHVELDLWMRYSDRFFAAGGSVPGVSNFDPRIPSSVNFDARIAWHPRKGLELALVGQNLAGSQREFNPTFVSTSATEVGRTVYGKLTWRF